MSDVAALDAADSAPTRWHAGRTRVDAVLVEPGARTCVEEVRATASDGELRTSPTEPEDVDIAEELVTLRAQELTHQAALDVTARVVQPSLLDFLR